MTWDLCHFTVLQQKHTRALSYVLYLSLWCGVVWSDLNKNGLCVRWDCVSCLTVTALVLPQKIGSYAAVRSAIYLI